MSMIVLFLI